MERMSAEKPRVAVNGVLQLLDTLLADRLSGDIAFVAKMIILAYGLGIALLILIWLLIVICTGGSSMFVPFFSHFYQYLSRFLPASFLYFISSRIIMPVLRLASAIIPTRILAHIFLLMYTPIWFFILDLGWVNVNVNKGKIYIPSKRKPTDSVFPRLDTMITPMWFVSNFLYNLTMLILMVRQTRRRRKVTIDPLSAIEAKFQSSGSYHNVIQSIPLNAVATNLSVLVNNLDVISGIDDSPKFSEHLKFVQGDSTPFSGVREFDFEDPSQSPTAKSMIPIIKREPSMKTFPIPRKKPSLKLDGSTKSMESRRSSLDSTVSIETSSDQTTYSEYLAESPRLEAEFEAIKPRAKTLPIDPKNVPLAGSPLTHLDSISEEDDSASVQAVQDDESPLTSLHDETQDNLQNAKPFSYIQQSKGKCFANRPIVERRRTVHSTSNAVTTFNLQLDIDFLSPTMPTPGLISPIAHYNKKMPVEDKTNIRLHRASTFSGFGCSPRQSSYTLAHNRLITYFNQMVPEYPVGHDPITGQPYYSYKEIVRRNYCKDFNGLNPQHLELYLADEDFYIYFNMTKDEFKKIVKWRQVAMKKALTLF